MPEIEVDILDDMMPPERRKYTCDAGNILILKAVRIPGPRS
jgi:hypothetical protein